jgi:hypothetical protein
MHESLRRNTDPRFVGIAELKRKQAEQLATFERWATRGDWQAIHNAHYDWWMFPLDERSQHGDAYTVYAGDIAELKQDPAYVRSYLRGVELLALAWGWDLAARQYLAHPQRGQAWSRWPIRLYKAARSLQLFGYTDEFESLKAFALDLLRKGESLRYGRDDLARLFTDGIPRR